ncbi:hypothetical protein [Dinoroseobacter sp. S76]|uniref:hypothetical protein n=1 Tax=Dinoroseobacter sp. S76 TaxID=3415124 RepID=UPI003C7AAF44
MALMGWVQKTLVSFEPLPSGKKRLAIKLPLLIVSCGLLLGVQFLASESQVEGSGYSPEAQATLDGAIGWIGIAVLFLIIAFVFDKLSFKWPFFALLRIPFVALFLFGVLVATGLAGLALLS